MPRVSEINKALPRAVQRELAQLGGAVRATRISRALTQRQLGERVGVSERTIRSVESGSDSVNVGIVLTVIWALGMKLPSPFIGGQPPESGARPRQRAGAARRDRAPDDF